MPLHPDVKKYYVFRALLKRFALPILVLYGLDQGLTLGELSFIAAVGSIVSFVCELPSGAIADRIGHRRTLVLSMLGQALSMALYLGGTFWWMLGGVVVYMGFGSLMTGTAEAFFFERLEKLGLASQHAKLSGAGKGFATAVSVISMALAGVLYEVAWWLPFVVGVLQFVLAAVVVATIGPTHDEISIQRRESSRVSVVVHIRSAWTQIREQPFIFWLIISSALIVGPLFSTGDFQQAVMDDVGMSAALIGAIYAAKRLLSVLLQASTYRIMRLLTPAQFVLLCALFMLLYFFGLGIIIDPGLLLGPLLIGSLAWVGLEIAVNDYINQRIQTGSRATLLSMNNFIRNFVGVLAIAVFGVVTRDATAAYGYLVLGCVFTIILFIPLVQLFRHGNG